MCDCSIKTSDFCDSWHIKLVYGQGLLVPVTKQICMVKSTLFCLVFGSTLQNNFIKSLNKATVQQTSSIIVIVQCLGLRHKDSAPFFYVRVESSRVELVLVKKALEMTGSIFFEQCVVFT